MHRRCRQIVLLFCALFTAIPATLSAAALEVISLNYRTAEELLPALKPLLDADGRISGLGHELVISSSRNNIAVLGEVVKRLDVAPRQLLISFRRARSGARHNHGIELTNRPTGTPKPPSVRLYSNSVDRDEQGVEQIRTIEGHWSYLSRGISIPVVEHIGLTAQGDKLLERGIGYREMGHSIEIMARVAGEQAVIALRPRSTQPSAHLGGALSSHSLTTNLLGKIGEWLDVSGTQGQQQDDQRSLSQSKRRTAQRAQRLQVKVELVRMQ